MKQDRGPCWLSLGDWGVMILCLRVILGSDIVIHGLGNNRIWMNAWSFGAGSYYFFGWLSFWYDFV